MKVYAYIQSHVEQVEAMLAEDARKRAPVVIDQLSRYLGSLVAYRDALTVDVADFDLGDWPVP